jgi:hypothetical protein
MTGSGRHKAPHRRAARRAVAVAALAAAGALAGCAADSPIVENFVVVPGYYDTLSCPELIGQIQGSAGRMKELTGLMEKSAGNAAGPVVNAMAYNTDYAKARATNKFADEAARRKGCDLTKTAPAFKPNEPAPNVGIPNLAPITQGPGGR